MGLLRILQFYDFELTKSKYGGWIFIGTNIPRSND